MIMQYCILDSLFLMATIAALSLFPGYAYVWLLIFAAKWCIEGVVVDILAIDVENGVLMPFKNRRYEGLKLKPLK